MRWEISNYPRTGNRDWHDLIDDDGRSLSVYRIRKNKDGWGIYEFANIGWGLEPLVAGPFDSLEAAKFAFVILWTNRDPSSPQQSPKL